MTYLEFLTETAVIASVIESGQSLSTEERTLVLDLFNELLDSWSTERLNIYSVSGATYALTAGTGSYPISSGSASPFNVARPTMIESANVITTGALSTNMEVIGAVEWSNITDRAMTAVQPLKVYCDYAYPLSTVSVWPIPSGSCSIELFYYTAPPPFVFPQDPSAYPSEEAAVQAKLQAAVAAASQAILAPAGTFTMSAGVGTYTMGPGGTWNTTRPLKIQSANAVVTTTLRQPLRLISSVEWAAIENRTAQSDRPISLYYDNKFPIANLNLWPVPKASVTTLELFTWDVLTQISNTGDTITLPTGYKRPLQYGLATMLPSAFGLQVPEEVARIALESKATLRGLNAQIVQPGTQQAPPAQ